MLHAVPLQILLDWLPQPKGPNLVEASTAAAPDKALALWGRASFSGSGARVQAALHFHGAIQCCLHASACMAHCWLQCGVRGQAEFITTPLCEHL